MKTDTPLPSKLSRHRVKRLRRSAQALGNAENLADSAPDNLDVLAVRERLADRAAAQRREHVIFRNALGIRLAELSAHPFPEGSQAHAGQATPPAADSGIWCQPARLPIPYRDPGCEMAGRGY